MKICYFAPAIKIPGSDGGSTHVTEVTKELARYFQIYLLACKSKDFIKDNISLIDVDSKSRIIKLVKTLIAGIIPVIKSDLVYERTDVLGVGSFLSVILMKPLILETNSAIIDERTELILTNKIIRKIVRIICNLWLKIRYTKASRIITTVNTLVPEEFRSKIYPTEWGVNIEKFRPDIDGILLRKELNLMNKKIILFSGVGGPWHGVDDLLKSADVVLEKNPNVVFLVIGMEKNSNIKTNDRILILGRVPYEQVPKYLSIADVLVAPFNPDYLPTLKKYGFYWSPLKLFEYMAMGKPIVTTKPLSRIIDDKKDGLLVEPGNINELSAAILYMLDNPLEAKQMGESARKKVIEKYSWERHAKNLSKMIDDIMK